MNLNTVGQGGKSRLKPFSSDDEDIPLTLSQKLLRFIDFKDTTTSDDDEVRRNRLYSVKLTLNTFDWAPD